MKRTSDSKSTMKVGVLAFSTCTNYGALLQIYALQECIRSFGHLPRVVNLRVIRNNKYLYGVVRNPNAGFGTRVRGLLKFLTSRRFRSFEERYPKFIEWRKAHFDLTEREWRSTQELVDNPPDIDKLVVGSDQVFNRNVANVFLCRGMTPSIVRVSYGASFGSVNADEGRTLGIDSGLREFSALSARENTGRKLIGELINADVPWVIDPTVLADRRIWQNLIEESSPPQSDSYLMIYWIGSVSSVREPMKRIIRRIDLPVHLYVATYDKQLPLKMDGVTVHLDANPSEFLSALKNADAVLSNSFHAMMFSAVFAKRAAFVISGEADRRGSASRFTDIASVMKCEPALFDSLSGDIEFFDMKDAYHNLDEMRNTSRHWLEEAINV